MLWILHLKSKRSRPSAYPEAASKNDQLQVVTWSEEMDDSSQRILARSHASSLTSYEGCCKSERGKYSSVRAMACQVEVGGGAWGRRP